MSEARALIYFRCTNPEHRESAGTKSDWLTIHEGKWAYCGHDIRAKNHAWTATNGLTLDQVRSAQRRATQ